MILTDYDIEQRRLAFDAQIPDKDAPPSVHNVNVIGHRQWYFFAVKGGDKEGICGLETRMLKISPPRNQDDEENDAYYVDLAVLTHVDGFYTELSDVRVTTISLTDPDGSSQTGVCQVEDLPIVKQLMNEKYDRANPRPRIKLVVSNPDPQDTPEQPT